ncbi:MAG: hypothetical protein U5K76_04885 [Woeseiaceae bacterium]|nr:hypothetical protein [Woeseiaceae bacterium]
MSAPKRLGRGLDALLKNQPRRISPMPSRRRATALDAAGSRPAARSDRGYVDRRQNVSRTMLRFARTRANWITRTGICCSRPRRCIRRLPGRVPAAETPQIIRRPTALAHRALVRHWTTAAWCCDLDDQSALAVALIENLQREDLNPIEQARSLLRLAEEIRDRARPARLPMRWAARVHAVGDPLPTPCRSR